MSAKSASKCAACEMVRVNTPGGMCVMHETSTSPIVMREVHLDPQRGPLGPVLVVAFAYIVGEVPRFTAEGRRIGDVTEYRPRRTGRTGTRRVA